VLVIVVGAIVLRTWRDSTNTAAPATTAPPGTTPPATGPALTIAPDTTVQDTDVGRQLADFPSPLTEPDWPAAETDLRAPTLAFLDDDQFARLVIDSAIALVDRDADCSAVAEDLTTGIDGERYVELLAAVDPVAAQLVDNLQAEASARAADCADGSAVATADLEALLGLLNQRREELG